METFLTTTVILLLSTCVLYNFYYLQKMIEKIESLEEFQRKIAVTLIENTHYYEIASKKIDGITYEIERQVSALKEQIESTKPIKSNNWDRINQAFTRPTRVDLNE